MHIIIVIISVGKGNLMQKNRLVYTFWLPMISEDFTNDRNQIHDTSIIKRIHNKLRFYLEIKRISEIDHISSEKENKKSHKEDAEDKLIAYSCAEDADKTFSYVQFKFVFNSQNFTLTVDEFGFYFIEFEFAEDNDDDKKIVEDLIDALFIESNNDKDDLNLLSNKQQKLLSSSLLNPDLVYKNFIANKESNNENIRQRKLTKFLHQIIIRVDIDKEIFSTQEFQKYQKEIHNYTNIIEERVYDLEYSKNLSDDTIEKSYVQDSIEKKAISNFLEIATSYSYLEKIQESVENVSSTLIDKIYFLSTNENIETLSHEENIISSQDEDIEQYIELTNYSTASFKTIDRLISYAYYIKIGNKTAYDSINSDEEISKVSSYSKWKMTIEDFETKVKNSLKLLQSHNEKKSYNELEEINRHHLSMTDNDSIKQLVNKDSHEKVGLSDGAMNRLQIFIGILTALSVTVPLSEKIFDSYNKLESFKEIFTQDVLSKIFVYIIIVLIVYNSLHFIVKTLINKQIKKSNNNQKTHLPFITLEYKSRHKIKNLEIQHIHHYDFNHEVFAILKSEQKSTINNMLAEMNTLLELLESKNLLDEKQQVKHALLYRKEKVYKKLIKLRYNIKLSLEHEDESQLTQNINLFNEPNIPNDQLHQHIKSFQNNPKYAPLIDKKFSSLNIPKEIQRHEYEHRIERVNQYKHKILIKYRCSDVEEEKEFTHYIFDKNVQSIIKDDIKKSNDDEEEINNLIEIIEQIDIKCLITYSFEIKSVAKKETTSTHNSLQNKIEHFNVHKDYIKIYFSLMIPKDREKEFLKIRNIVNYNISNTFYEKIIHHMHSNEGF